jgi:2-(1,2-epoxy-1,2-dihydrophenyl)acetyl-CoA isomerase
MMLVKLDRIEDIAFLTLNRPEAANAINLELAIALKSVAQQLAREGWARCVVVQAEGKLFSGGGDIAEMLQQQTTGSADDYQKFFRSLVLGLHEAVSALRALGVPLVAAVDGTAAGGGMSLVLACDQVVATGRAKFVPAYVGIGLSTDGGMSWSLPRIVGPRKALQLICDNRPITAEEAHALGIVTVLAQSEGFDAAVIQKARSLAALPRRAFASIRGLVERSTTNSFDLQLDAELGEIIKLCTASDALEGLEAFRAKRAPDYAD